MKKTKLLPIAILVVLILSCSKIYADRRIAVSGRDKTLEPKNALVIGNAQYKIGPLRNPVNDANDIAEILKQKGFNVEVLINASRKQMAKSNRKFGNKLKKEGGVGIFFLAGHGMQVNGVNYLIPIGADIGVEEDIEYESINANRVLSMMQNAGNRLNMVFLDACRDNPFARSFRIRSRGLAIMDAPKGTIIAFASAPGKTADDGMGKNGLFTTYLLKYMQEPGLELTKMIKLITRDVVYQSGQKQTCTSSIFEIISKV
jgi:uncharacterized caspase-like protein